MLSADIGAEPNLGFKESACWICFSYFCFENRGVYVTCTCNAFSLRFTMCDSEYWCLVIYPC